MSCLGAKACLAGTEAEAAASFCGCISRGQGYANITSWGPSWGVKTEQMQDKNATERDKGLKVRRK